MSLTLAKPEPRKREAARRKRQAVKVIKAVRSQCVDRDGFCRVWRDDDGAECPADSGCIGTSEWAHLGDKKRFKTRGQAPELRHTTAGSLMLCTKHHQDYDQGRMVIDGDDANLPLKFERV
jgi:hypothetical protein